MNTILTCIDERGNTAAVIEGAAWAARQLTAPLEFLHVLERHPEQARSTDLSGALGLDAQTALLNQLSEDDAARSRDLRASSRFLIQRAREQAAKLGVPQADGRLRHGDFLQTVVELQGAAQLLVLGEHYQAQAQQRVHLDHHMERVLRAVDRPVLVVTAQTFQPPQCAVIAFDGSSAGKALVQQAQRHPLLHGLPFRLVMAGEDSSSARQKLEEAAQVVRQAGGRTEIEFCLGAPENVLPGFLQSSAPAVLVMGANRHSRLRQLVFGSTTATLLRVSSEPVLVLG